jgi:hypothetical protein
MNALSLVLTAVVALVLARADDTTAQFPTLQTTVPEPRADGERRLAWCAAVDGARLCGDQLGQAWCRKRGFQGGFVKWTTALEGDIARCPGEDDDCPTVTTITCQGVPIVDE